MAKKCKKCVKTYDDTWKVCLFCGSKLKSDEECKDVCDTEGTTPEEEKQSLLTLEGITYRVVLVVFIVGVLALVYYFGSKFWTGVLEKFFWGTY